MGRKNDDPPLSNAQYAMLRVAHQAACASDRDHLTGKKREQCLFFVRLGEQVLRDVQRKQIGSSDSPPAPAADPHIPRR